MFTRLRSRHSAHREWWFEQAVLESGSPGSTSAPDPPPTSCMLLGELLIIPDSEFPHLHQG